MPHRQGRLSDPGGGRAPRRAPWRQVLHQAGPQVRVPPGADEAGGCAQDGVPHPRRPLRVPGDCIRAMQCPGDVPRRDE